MNINYIIKQFSNKFLSGDKRSVKLKKQALYSTGIKAASILIGLLYVPLLLDYLDSERYGIWLALSSIVIWFNFFDAGLGNGLRNKLTEALAKNQIQLAKEYISTTYALIAIIFLSFIVIFYCINIFINWNHILNTTLISAEELNLLVNIVFTFFLLRFILQLIGIILMADQRPAINNAFGPLANLIAFITIYILKQTTDNSSLVLLGLILSATPLLIYIIASFYFFNGDYEQFKPSLKFVKFSHSKNLMGIGLKLFVLQITGLVFISSSNFIIIQMLNSHEVTVYNVAYKYMQLPFMLFVILSQPLWSATTDAYHRNDLDWIRKTLKKYNLISFAFIFFIVVLAIISNFVYKIWINDRVDIPTTLTISIGAYTAIRILWMPYGLIINGIGKLHISMIFSIIGMLLFIPSAILLTNTELMSAGVAISAFFAHLFLYIISFIQVKKLINNTAVGLWNK